MPLTVADKSGKVLGVVVGHYQNHLLVAHNRDKCFLEGLCPLDKLEQIAASRLNAKDLLGRIQAAKLDNSLRTWWEQEQDLPAKSYEPQLAMRTLALTKRAYAPLKLFQTVKADYYFLCRDKKPSGGNIKIHLSESQLPICPEGLPFPALLATVTKYPEVELEVAGVGETLFLGGGLNDLGGHNHTHSTRLRILSGDVETELDLPGIILTKKDELLALEIKDDKGTPSFNGSRIFTGGVIYHYRT